MESEINNLWLKHSRMSRTGLDSHISVVVVGKFCALSLLPVQTYNPNLFIYSCITVYESADALLNFYSLATVHSADALLNIVPTILNSHE